MSAITTHVLDTARGRPAAGIAVTLEGGEGGDWTPLGRGTTDADGRVDDLLPSDCALRPGRYRITFETGDYYELQRTAALYPRVTIELVVERPDEHYHIPLLLSPFGYSTYRGS